MTIDRAAVRPRGIDKPRHEARETALAILQGLTGIVVSLGLIGAVLWARIHGLY